MTSDRGEPIYQDGPVINDYCSNARVRSVGTPSCSDLEKQVATRVRQVFGGAPMKICAFASFGLAPRPSGFNSNDNFTNYGFGVTSPTPNASVHRSHILMFLFP